MSESRRMTSTAARINRSFTLRLIFVLFTEFRAILILVVLFARCRGVDSHALSYSEGLFCFADGGHVYHARPQVDSSGEAAFQ